MKGRPSPEFLPWVWSVLRRIWAHLILILVLATWELKDVLTDASSRVVRSAAVNFFSPLKYFLMWQLLWALEIPYYTTWKVRTPCWLFFFEKIIRNSSNLEEHSKAEICCSNFSNNSGIQVESNPSYRTYLLTHFFMTTLFCICNIYKDFSNCN